MTQATPLTLDGKHTVLTPEYVEFNFVLAGLLSRFLALAIDTVVSVMLTMVVVFSLALASIITGGFAGAMMLMLWFLIDWGYFVLLEVVWSGQTIGKRALGLRVIQESGVRVGFYQSVVRNLLRPLDKLPIFYFVGGTAALFSASQQRLGDILAGTVVIRERKLKIPASLARPEGDVGLLDDPYFRSLVQRLPADEEQLLVSAAMRREELSIEARLALFSAISERLQTEWGFGRPEHLSDEKLVLLVTAALVARSAAQK